MRQSKAMVGWSVLGIPRSCCALNIKSHLCFARWTLAHHTGGMINTTTTTRAFFLYISTSHVGRKTDTKWIFRPTRSKTCHLMASWILNYVKWKPSGWKWYQSFLYDFKLFQDLFEKFKSFLCSLNDFSGGNFFTSVWRTSCEVFRISIYCGACVDMPIGGKWVE